jgi:hypothetical protein
VIWTVVALLLGLIVVAVLALFCSPVAQEPDPTTGGRPGPPPVSPQSLS